MAPPVSCANIRRLKRVPADWPSVEMNTGDPSGVVRGSTAIERPGGSGTPSAPTGPVSVSGIWRKKTKLGSLLNRVSRSMPVNLAAGSLAGLPNFDAAADDPDAAAVVGACAVEVAWSPDA